jgi:hypothetical protein
VLVSEDDELLLQISSGLIHCLSSIGPWPYAYLPVLPSACVREMAKEMSKSGTKYIMGYNSVEEETRWEERRRMREEKRWERRERRRERREMREVREGEKSEESELAEEERKEEEAEEAGEAEEAEEAEEEDVLSSLPSGVMVVDLRSGIVTMTGTSLDYCMTTTDHLLPRSRELEIALRKSIRPTLFSLDNVLGYDNFLLNTVSSLFFLCKQMELALYFSFLIILTHHNISHSISSPKILLQKLKI